MQLPRRATNSLLGSTEFLHVDRLITVPCKGGGACILLYRAVLVVYACSMHTAIASTCVLVVFTVPCSLVERERQQVDP
jgi:hypothetical protein